MKDLYKRLVSEYRGLEITGHNPIGLLKSWIKDAVKAGNPEANAFVLSTGRISSRAVLLKFLRGRTLTFFTNYDSRKGSDLRRSKIVAANFYWGELHRQVRIIGTAKRSSPTVSDRYFASRPRDAQIAAHISRQSSTIRSRGELIASYVKATEQFADQRTIPRPTNWGGYDIKITEIEFWQGMPSRLHDRLVFSFRGKGWAKKRLAP